MSIARSEQRRFPRRGLRLMTVGLMLAGGLLVGCKSNSGMTIEDLRLENQELRARNSEMESALRSSENRMLDLEDVRERLIAENDQLRGQLTDVQSRPNTGFEGIAGTQTSMRAGELVVSVAGDVLFDSGKATLKSSSKATLDEVASVIRSRYGGNMIRIAGHTDTDPIRKSQWKTNERLSAERALAVEEYLASKGISNDLMYIAAYGPAQPRGSKKDSRRVEIVILGQSGS